MDRSSSSSTWEKSLVIEARAPCGLGEEVGVRLPGGGIVRVVSPVSEGNRFRVVVSESSHEDYEASALSLLERELEESEESSSEEEEVESTLSLESILHRWAPYLLDFLPATDARLALVYLECEQHKRLSGSSVEEMRKVLAEHATSVYETYVAPGAPKLCDVSRGVASRLAKSRDRRDSLAELGAAVLGALREKHAADFVRSESYRKLLRDAASPRSLEVRAPRLVDVPGDSTLRRFFAAETTDPAAVRAWCRAWSLVRVLKKPHGVFASQVRAELRGAAHKLLARPPIAFSKSLSDRLSALFRRERNFDANSAITMYAAVFADVEAELREVVERVWTSFLESRRYAAYACAERPSDLDVAVAKATTRSRDWWNPVFAWCSEKGTCERLADTGLERHDLLLVVDSRALGGDDGFSSEGSGDNRSESDDDVSGALLTLCDERDVPSLVVALLLEIPVTIRGKKKLKAARRLRAIADSLPFRRARMRSEGDTCLVFDDADPLILDLDSRSFEKTTFSKPISSLPAARCLSRAIRNRQFKTLQAIDVAADDTTWRRPLDVYDGPPHDDASLVDAFEGFVESLFLDPIRLFATRATDHHHVVTFRLAEFRVLVLEKEPSSSSQHLLPLYHALFTSRRFADAMVDSCFWPGPSFLQRKWAQRRPAGGVEVPPHEEGEDEEEPSIPSALSAPSLLSSN
ncbi:hypothetical protein CTAYLR_008459 [Chrysophaeum taylorii]|uniref:RGS domain-containing protein n=1 Tax=Chrysophaeum taylorii TaxID=2483200 RepID=A0AAD7UBY3_9STRA|nr:hypothetical protein CTAYLR_008459 [Chrysophaeum taylorii]